MAALTSPHPVFYSFAEYVRLEDGSTVKHEYLEGHIYAMAGGTPDHAALAAEISATIVAAIRGGRCRAHSSDLRIRVRETGLATYPDVSVVCGPRELDPEDRNTVTNPTLLVEVTSKSTDGYDRGKKFEHYRQIPSLREYVLVSHAERAIEVRRREANGDWSTTVSRAGECADLKSIDGVVDVDALYDAAAEPTE
jgi:Uma2 family endonuclease